MTDSHDHQDDTYAAEFSHAEADILAQALAFWASEHDGVYPAQELDLAREMAEGIREAMVEELDGSETHTLPIVITGISDEDLLAVAETLHESAAYGTEFDAVLHDVAQQIEQAVEAEHD